MKALVIASLIPMAIGPLPQAERTLTMSICNGGEITIPIGDKNNGRERDCHQQGCHAGNCREKTKGAKRLS